MKRNGIEEHPQIDDMEAYGYGEGKHGLSTTVAASCALFFKKRGMSANSAEWEAMNGRRRRFHQQKGRKP